MLNEYLNRIHKSIYKLITFPKSEHPNIKKILLSRKTYRHMELNNE